MKFAVSFVFAIVVVGALAYDETPIDKVVSLIKGLAANIEKDGKDEQASYDKYACWVEDTIQRKASDITAAKALIGELDESIMKTKAEIASHGAEIAQLTKDIAQNNQAQKEAKGIRNKENKEYAGERSESEQCLGALEAAITVLTGAGTKKGGFLQQVQEAQLMSVAMGVRKALQHARSSELSDANLEVVRRFVEKPQIAMSTAMSAAQTGQNPFGDYAPQSSQIQGILKGMYDAFASDLEKDNANEANGQKAFEALMETKQQELATLTATLQKQESDAAAKTKKLAEEEVLREDTTEQLAADEKFFDETKEAAESKATAWSVRVRLRTEELAGMEGAIQILSGGSKVFEEATTTFLQLKDVQRHGSAQHKAYGELKLLSAKYQTSSLNKLVAVMRTGGHFDKVMIMIDHMMALLRAEEQDDIKHRDRCENGENANANSMEDAQGEIAKTDKKLGRLDRRSDDTKKELESVEGEIKESKANMKKLLEMRNEEYNDFTRALKMDMEAISLIGMAIVRLSSYYKENKIPISLIQAPEYTKDADKAPETTFSGADAHQGESTGIVAILEMLKEDLQKEIKEGRADDAKAQAEYEKQNGALQDSLDAQKESKVSLEKELSSLGDSIAAAEGYKNEKKDDLDSEKDMKKSLATDCTWVKDHFKSRRDARKTEMAGLVEAKNFLAGVEAGDAVLPPALMQK